MGPPPRPPGYSVTSLVRIAIRFVPGTPPDFYILTAFPAKNVDLVAEDGVLDDHRSSHQPAPYPSRGT